MNKRKGSKHSKYTLNELLTQSDKSTLKGEDPIPGVLESEWPPHDVKPFAYRIVDWRGTHLAVVQSRHRAHKLQRNPDIDPRLNWIYAIYPDESEKLIQGGLSIMDNLQTDDFEMLWKKSMQSLKIESMDIEETLNFYRHYNPRNPG